MTTSDQPAISHIGHPLGLRIAIVLTLIMIYRLTPIFMLSEVGESIPEFWGVAFRGDIFIGATAPVVAWLLWRRRGLGVWTVGLVWHFIGIKDFIAGLEFHLIQPFDPSMGSIPVVILGGGPLVHLIAVYFLIRHRAHYLSR